MASDLRSIGFRGPLHLGVLYNRLGVQDLACGRKHLGLNSGHEV